MRPSNRGSKQISRSSGRLFLLLLVASGLAIGQQQPPAGISFEVLSVRRLGSVEAAERSPDFVGPNVAVRLRLSASKQGINFYTWKNSAIPSGYKVQLRESRVFWLYGESGTERRNLSPGLKSVLYGSVGEWMTLPSNCAVEWEELDSTSFGNETHAFTVFVRADGGDDPKEIMSNTFLVPATLNTSLQQN